MLTKRVNHNQTHFIAELLQNGTTVATYQHPLSRAKIIRMGTTAHCELGLPHYPFPIDCQLATIKGSKVELNVDPQWRGFVTARGRIHDLTENSVNPLQLDLGSGDYGSFYVRDLQILIKIDKPKSTPQIKRSNAYRGSMLNLLFDTKRELPILVLGFLMSMVAFAPALYFLSSKPYEVPQKFADLQPHYLEPFFYPDHLEHTPELLQNQIDRTQFHRSSLEFIRAITGMYMGWETGYDQRFLFRSSLERFQFLHDRAFDKLADKKNDQARLEANFLLKPKTALISIPTVQGESIHGSIQRIFSKLGSVHESAKLLLANRRLITEDFEQDEPYDDQAYKNLRKRASSGAEALAKIKPFHLLTNEEQMYEDARRYAKQASRAQKQLQMARAPFHELDEYHPIAVPSQADFLSFLYNARVLVDESKLSEITATEYEQRKIVKVKEPLIGEIDPKLIEQAISRRRYELQLCFEVALRRQRVSDGRMEWKWRIDSRGRISDLSLISSTIRDPNMLRCVRKKIAGWSFPRPRRGSVEVRYPFQFSKRNG